MLIGVVFGCSGGGESPRGESSSASGDNSERPLEKADLVLNWFPEAEHGGFYAALVHGYYREAGIDMTILPGGVDIPVSPRVGTGRVMFGVNNAEQVLLGRAEEVPIVALMAPIQGSPRCILVHEESGITSLNQLNQVRTLAMSSKDPFSFYLRSRVDLTGVNIVPYPGNVLPFLVNKDYAMQGYVFSEPFVARERGANPRALMMSELGWNPYTSCLITSEALLRENPDLVRRVTHASVRGWVKYLQDPTETNKYIHSLNTEMGMDILEYGTESLRELSLTPDALENGVGWMKSDRWEGLFRQLVDAEVLRPNSLRVNEAFTMEFYPTGEDFTRYEPPAN
jgi:NitT/TauT family transport system substrate-binding protein